MAYMMERDAIFPYSDDYMVEFTENDMKKTIGSSNYNEIDDIYYRVCEHSNVVKLYDKSGKIIKRQDGKKCQ